MSRKYNIGVLIGSIFSRYSKDLMNGIHEASQGEEITVFYFVGTQIGFFYQDTRNTAEGRHYDAQFNTIYDYALCGNLDVLIISYGTLCIFFDNLLLEDFLAKFKDIPILLLEEVDKTGHGHYLVNDNYGSFGQIMEHLAGFHGYRKIGHISGPLGNNDATERRETYLRSMAEYGLPATDEMIVYGDFSQYIEEQVERLLDNNPGLEAICAANDEMAAAAYNVCRRRGLTVGKDIAITGYDDCSIAASLTPPLTTVDQNAYSIGYCALQSALEMCRHLETVDGRKQVLGMERLARHLRPEFRRRCSCGCEPEEAAGQSLQPTVVINYEKELLEFQKKVWTGPLVVRDMISRSKDEKDFFRAALEKMDIMNIHSAYIYILKNPLRHPPGSLWECPDEMLLASCLADGEIVSYAPEKRPVISKKTGFDYHNTWKAGQNLVAFTLSSEEMQFGVLLCDMRPQDVTSMYVISLQLGTALSFLELSRLERLASEQLYKSMEIIREKNMVLSYISEIDELTGLPNRRSFMERAIHFGRENSGKEAYLIFADLDHLKQINDYFGHAEGDEAIRAGIQVVREVSGKAGIAARLGGDEFVALFLAEPTDDEATLRTRFRDYYDRFNHSSGKPYYVECSVGIKTFACREDWNLLDTMSEADTLLYHAKEKRRKDVRKPQP